MSCKIFKPKLIILVILITIIPIFIHLGFWQLERAEYKKILINQININSELPPIEISHLQNKEYKNIRFKKVILNGMVINEKNILLDNQIQNKQAGYKLLTPIKINGTNKFILLDRGFIKKPRYDQKLAYIQPLAKNTSINAIINTPTTGIDIISNKKNNKQQVKNNWPLIIQYINFSELENIFQQKIFNFVAQQENNDNNIQIKKSYIDFNTQIFKHKSYAYQWFIFAILSIIYSLILLLNYIKYKVKL